MKIAGLIRDSLSNGYGVRDVVFLQGCKHQCKGCHNPHTWNMNGGMEVEEAELARDLQTSSNDITISGGEPLLQYPRVLQFMYEVNKIDSTKHFWLYTGYKYEDVPDIIWRMLSHYHLDVVVDGKFEQENKASLPYCGSTNQRVIDLQKTVETGEIVLWEEV